MDYSWTTTRPVKIHCHCFNQSGHAIPMLKKINILQRLNPNFDITFFSSKWYVDKIKGAFSDIKMIGVEEDNHTSQEQFYSLMKNSGPKGLRQLLFTQSKKYLEERCGKDKPDLMICDIFMMQAMRYAKKHQIKFIVDVSMPYQCLQNFFCFPTFKRSFELGPLTCCYSPFNRYVALGFLQFVKEFQYAEKIFVNSAIGLEMPTIVPTHVTFTGLLTDSKKENQLDPQIKQWIEKWKLKGKNKFVLLSFGSMLKLSKRFMGVILSAIQKAQFPTILVHKEDYGMVNSPLVLHRSWINQQSVLSLQEVRCLVTHCGWGSIKEATSFETPMVCIPMVNDAIMNASLVEQRGIGIKIYEPFISGSPASLVDPNISSNKLSEAIKEIMNNETYYKNIVEVNAVCKEYRSEQIVNDAVHSTLKFGRKYYFDDKFQRAAQPPNIWLYFTVFVIAILCLCFEESIIKLLI